jgi:hypothetical protein
MVQVAPESDDFWGHRKRPDTIASSALIWKQLFSGFRVGKPSRLTRFWERYSGERHLTEGTEETEDTEGGGNGGVSAWA